MPSTGKLLSLTTIKIYNLLARGYGFTTNLELVLVADKPERSVKRLEAKLMSFLLVFVNQFCVS